MQSDIKTVGQSLKFIFLAIFIIILMIFGFSSLNPAINDQQDTSKQAISDSKEKDITQKKYTEMHYKIMNVLKSSKDTLEIEKAIEALKALAQLDYAQAQNDLGVIYLQGVGVDVDKSKAGFWTSRAALQKNIEATYNLAVMHLQGDGFKRNEKKAQKILNSSLLENYTDAQVALALMHIDGIVKKPNYSKALALLLKASQKDNAYAQYRLGLVYFNGQLVSKDIQEAKRWLKFAAENNNTDATALLKQTVFK